MNLYRFKRDNLYGVVSYEGDIIFLPSYDNIGFFEKKIASALTQDGKNVIINNSKTINADETVEYLHINPRKNWTKGE